MGYTPAFGADGFSRKQLARPAPCRCSCVKLAIGAGVAGLVFRISRLARIVDITQRLGCWIINRYRRQIGSTGKARQAAHHGRGDRRACYRFQKSASRFNIFFIRHGQASVFIQRPLRQIFSDVTPLSSSVRDWREWLSFKHCGQIPHDMMPFHLDVQTI